MECKTVFSLEVIEGNSQVNNIFITNYKVKLLNHVYATVVLVFYCEKETGFMQIHHPGAQEEENPVPKYVQHLRSNLSS